MRKTFVTLAATALTLAAAAGLSSADNTRNMAPADYFRTLVSVQDPGGWSTVLSGDLDLPGTQVRISVKIYLFSDGRYLGVYWQGRRDGTYMGGQAWADTHERFVQSSWSVSGRKLMLSGFGAGTGNGRGIDLGLDRDFVAAGVRGKTVPLRLTRTSAGHEVMRRVLRRNNIKPAF